MLSKRLRQQKTGFTLLEILVVILIVGMLFVLLVPKLSSLNNSSNEAGVKTKFREFQNAAEIVMLENSGFRKTPSSDTDLEWTIKALNNQLDDANKFDLDTIQGSYCDSNAVDPWNNHYKLYIYKDTITFISYGNKPVNLHAEEFNYDTEKCKYSVSVDYREGKVFINTQGFTVNIEEEVDGTDEEPDEEQNSQMTRECFSWNGSTITGFSGTCGHTDEEHANVDIPDECTAIGNSAFQYCYNIETLNIPGSVKTIGNEAFLWCKNISSATLSEGLQTIGQQSFTRCEKMSNVTIPNSVTKIGNRAFSYCMQFTSLVVPDSVTTIEFGAFKDCIRLKSVKIPSNSTFIVDSLFRYCTSLTDIEIPSGVTTIEKDAFKQCYSLNLNIPDTVTTIVSGSLDRVSHVEYHGIATGGPWGASSMN